MLASTRLLVGRMCAPSSACLAQRCRGAASTAAASDQGLYPGHIRTSLLQKAILTVGSAAMAITDPYRHDMVAVLGETTGHLAFPYMLQRMKEDAVGRQILQDRPRITSESLRMDSLKDARENTLGREYYNFMTSHNISPDTRANVRFVDDAELAYVCQRYREVHDFFHVLLALKPNLVGEIALKGFEAVQTHMPMCALGALFGPLRMNQKQRQMFGPAIPWSLRSGQRAKFLMNVYFEKRLGDDIDDLRRELNIEMPPRELCWKVQ